MALSKEDTKQLLYRLIFAEDSPDDWVQDVWGLSPTLGDTAAKLVDVMEALVECCPDEKLENLLQGLYQEMMDNH
jgi:hypothetical protein